MSSASIQAKILSIVAVFVVGFTIHSTIVHRTTPESWQTSAYRDVITTKDLIADILPPPLFVIESELVAMQAARELDVGERSRLRERWKKLQLEFASRQAFWNENQESGALRTALLENTKRSAERLFSIGDNQLWPAIDAGDSAKVKTALNDLDAAYRDHRANVDEVVALADKQIEAQAETAVAAIQRRKAMFLAIGVLVTLVGAVVALGIARGIAGRTRDMNRTLAAVARGDLRQRAEVHGRDEIGQMAEQLNQTLASIERAFSEVNTVTHALSSAAKNLARSSDQISQGAQQQAASLEETAASLEEITATVKQSAQNAQQADEVAQGSRDVAERGGSVVAGAISAMDEITKASRRIGDIITTIDEIALQTNLLALNAAVEAARAGEQGRGFAVVASEVGNLAQRSAAAAKEVKSLIQDSLGRIQTGHELVGESGRALNDIILSVKKVTNIVGEIASASREQSIGVDQVNQAVSQMDQVTQSNAAQTDELSHTAQGLADHAEQLRHLLARFQLSQRSAGGSSSDAGQPPAAAMGKRRGAALAAPPTYDFGARAAASNDNTDEAPDFEVLSGKAGDA
jgi:methyl-accepting chemotaxis protein